MGEREDSTFYIPAQANFAEITPLRASTKKGRRSDPAAFALHIFFFEWRVRYPR
jgi:hypothetical protein